MAFNPEEHLMLDFKGKGNKYLQVMWRLVWLRDKRPDAQIETECIERDENHAVFKATIADNGTILATAHGSEEKKDFKDFLEKAETKAIGRALAMCGYGTQFTGDELDEGDRIVDSPVKPRNEGDKIADSPVKPRENDDEDDPVVPDEVICVRCGKPITSIITKKGEKFTASQLVGKSKHKYGACYCYNCMQALSKANKNGGAE